MSSAVKTSPSPALDLRAQVEEMGGQLVKQAGAVFDLFAGQSPSDIEGRLAFVGLGVKPNLAGTARENFVVLYLLRRDEQDVPHDDVPTSATQEAIEQAAAGASGGSVLTGIVIASAGFAVMGFAGWWAYGLIYALFGLLGFGIWRWRPHFFPRFFIPRWSIFRLGWLLGLVSVIPLMVIASLLVVSPIYNARVADGEREYAAAHLALARAALKDGDLDRADRELENARGVDDKVAGLTDTQQDVKDERDRLAEEQRKADKYAQGQQEARDRQWAGAINAMEELGDYRDARAKAAAYRRRAADESLAKARRLVNSDPQGAIAAAKEARGFHSSAAQGAVIRQARKVIAVRKAQRIDAERAAAARRAAARAERRRQRELARQREQAEQQAELEALSTPSTDSYSDGGYDSGGDAGNWCGATRDGDGDGIWCEGR